MWKKIAKSEYRRCAIVESYESIKHILVYKILRQNSADHILVKSLFEDHIDSAINSRKLALTFSLGKLPEVHQCLLTVVKKILAQKTDEVLSDSCNHEPVNISLSPFLCTLIRDLTCFNQFSLEWWDDIASNFEVALFFSICAKS